MEQRSITTFSEDSIAPYEMIDRPSIGEPRYIHVFPQSLSPGSEPRIFFRQRSRNHNRRQCTFQSSLGGTHQGAPSDSSAIFRVRTFACRQSVCNDSSLLLPPSLAWMDLKGTCVLAIICALLLHPETRTCDNVFLGGRNRNGTLSCGPSSQSWGSANVVRIDDSPFSSQFRRDRRINISSSHDLPESP
jgi:hypothetical protein